MDIDDSWFSPSYKAMHWAVFAVWAAVWIAVVVCVVRGCLSMEREAAKQRAQEAQDQRELLHVVIQLAKQQASKT